MSEFLHVPAMSLDPIHNETRGAGVRMSKRCWRVDAEALLLWMLKRPY
jgi:hypothetical protein